MHRNPHNRTFFSLAELNQAIWELLEELNHRTMRHLGKSRRELFEALERPALKRLPTEPYELAIWKKAKVNIDYHVEFDKHYYSVPHQLIVEEVFIRAAERTVEIFHKHCRVASHPRSRDRGRYTTQADHMPPAHRYPGLRPGQATPSGPLTASCAGRRRSGPRPER